MSRNKKEKRRNIIRRSPEIKPTRNGSHLSQQTNANCFGITAMFITWSAVKTTIKLDKCKWEPAEEGTIIDLNPSGTWRFQVMLALFGHSHFSSFHSASFILSSLFLISFLLLMLLLLLLLLLLMLWLDRISQGENMTPSPSSVSTTASLGNSK